jgi:hypothetical protein
MPFIPTRRDKLEVRMNKIGKITYTKEFINILTGYNNIYSIQPAIFFLALGYGDVVVGKW